MTAINSSETKATSVLCIRFRVSDIILVAYQVMDHWAKNRSDHKNKQDNGPESCFIKKKKSDFWHIHFLPKHVTSVYKWIYKNKKQTFIDNLYGSVSCAKHFIGIISFTLHNNSRCCYYLQLGTIVVEPPIFSIIHLVLTWVDDVFVCVHLVLCEDFIVFIIRLICVCYISSQDQLLKKQKHLPLM